MVSGRFLRIWFSEVINPVPVLVNPSVPSIGTKTCTLRPAATLITGLFARVS